MDAKITDNSKHFIEELKRKIPIALEAIGLTAENHAKKDTPVDTGRLRNSIAHLVDDNSVYIGTNVEYAPYIELGARGRKAHHMLGNAATQHSAEYKRLAKQALES